MANTAAMPYAIGVPSWAATAWLAQSPSSYRSSSQPKKKRASTRLLVVA
jgi:hypothetical protein